MIRIESLSVSYGSHPALRDVNLDIRRGCITAIVGPSGCGKSSLLAALNRMTDLVPDAVVRGRVLLDGLDVSCASPADLRRRIGMVFQAPTPFPMSIRQNIQLALRDRGLRDKAELEAVSRQVLEDVGLWSEVRERLDRSALELSGGQQQRLCIARALALEPEVLLMDEPCSSLDPLASAVVEELILKLRGRYTIVVVTHNLAQAHRLADDVAVFWLKDGAGVMIEHGPADEVFERPSDALAADYLRGVVG